MHSFDYYVALAQPILQKLHITDSPYAIVEGIYRRIDTEETSNDCSPSKTIMYAGGIQTRYGVFDLIESFHRLQGDDFHLILCGSCLEMDKLHTYLDKDKRIEYLGLISTSEVRKMQRRVSLLVNPRHSTEEFTKYSFPSKTLEYMASGTPVLMSNLPSMPDEYKEHLFLFKDESIDGMSQMIEQILSLSVGELKKKGSNAKNFILKYKNSEVQVRKILNLIIE